MWLVKELDSGCDLSEQVGEAFSVCLMSLMSDDINVAVSACSCLRTLVKFIPTLLNLSRECVETIMTAISLITTKLIVSITILL